MTYIANLQIKVDSTEVESATDKLHELIQASKGLGNSPLSKPLPPVKPPPQPKQPKSSPDDKSADKLLAQIDKQTGSLQKLTKQQSMLNQARDAGTVSDDSFAKYNQIIETNKKAVLDRGNVVEQASKKEIAAEQARLDAWYKSADGRKTVDSEYLDSLAKGSQARQKRVAEEDASERQRLDSWFANADKQKKAEAKDIEDRHSALATASKDRIKQEAAAQKARDAIDKAKKDSTLAASKADDDAAAKAELASKKRQKALDDEAKGLQNLLAAIDPVTKERQRLAKLEAELEKNYSSGKITEQQRGQYQSVIDEARQKTDRYKNSLGRTALTAKQLQMAQAGLPAQFTDIAVSLQGGQAPLTVFLQQGGQIKDMFGGTVPAIKGVTSAFVGLINPITILGATVLALGGIWYDAERRMSALNAAIYKGNELVGTSKFGLEVIAEGATVAGNSVAEAQEAITALAATGEVSSSRLANFGKAAQAIAVTSGKDISAVAEEMATLGDTATEKAEKLSEKYAIVTAEQYETIRALEKKGETEEAMDVLSSSLAGNAQERLQRYRDSLSDLERDWMDVKTAISNAYGAVRAELFPDLNDEITQLQRIIKTRKEGGVTGTISSFLGFGDNSDEALSQQLQSLINRRDFKNKYDAEVARRNQANKEVVESEKKLFKDLEKAGKTVKKNEYLEDLNKEFDSLVENAKTLKTIPKLLEGVTWTTEGGYKGGAYDTLKAEAERKFKEKQPKTPKSAILDNTDANEFQNQVNEVKARYKSMNEDIIQAQNAGTISMAAGVTKRKALLEQEATQVKDAYEKQIASLEALKGSKNISANQVISIDRQIADARSKMVVAQEESEKQLKKLAGDEETRLKKQSQAISAYAENLNQMVKNLEVAGQRQRAALSMSSGQAGLQDQLSSEDDRYNEEQRTLTLQLGEAGRDQTEVIANLRASAAAHTAMKKQIVTNYEEMKAAQADWGAGVSSAFHQYIEDGQNYAQMTNQAFTSAFTGMEDALVNFVTTGKLSFADLTKSILADMARIAVRIAASRALMAIFQVWGGPKTADTASMNSATAYGDGIAAAKGAAFDGGTQYFAKGGSFTNSIVSKPTSFATNKSNNNVMGEAGPEAIMPLTRSADGSLGVRASVDVSGLQQGGGSGVQVYITVDGQGNTKSSATDSGYSSFGNDVGQFVDQRYKQLISKDLQPGGDIWKSMQS
jgi:lambda family phage tail tape measure protein